MKQTIRVLYTVTQSPIDCSAVLSLGTPTALTPLTYNAATTTQDIAAGNSGFFVNSEPVNCLLTSCSLLSYASGTCGTYSGRIRIPVNSSPWTINADKNVNLGYSETFCISCTNG